MYVPGSFAETADSSSLLRFSFAKSRSLSHCAQHDSRYDGAMELSLKVVWETIPDYLEKTYAESEDGLEKLSKWGFLYTMTASIVLATAAGMSIKFLGFPGDLPDVIKCVHQLGYVPMCQTLPMVSFSCRKSPPVQRLMMESQAVPRVALLHFFPSCRCLTAVSSTLVSPSSDC